MQFFDALDAVLRTDCICAPIVTCLASLDVAVSGEFGKFIASKYRDQLSSLAIFPGGIRERGHLDRSTMKSMEHKINGRRFVFFDDSLYSATTYHNVAAAISRLGGEISEAIVIYDGSPEWRSDVVSLYRFHD
jgi:hypothetical protein